MSNGSDTKEAERVEGICDWFNDAKGFGFLKPVNGGKDVFVHFSSIRKSGFRSLREGQRVTFLVVEGEKGLQAAEVEVLD